jgi:hypothetical protein
MLIKEQYVRVERSAYSPGVRAISTVNVASNNRKDGLGLGGRAVEEGNCDAFAVTIKPVYEKKTRNKSINNKRMSVQVSKDVYSTDFSAARFPKKKRGVGISYRLIGCRYGLKGHTSDQPCR